MRKFITALTLAFSLVLSILVAPTSALAAVAPIRCKTVGTYSPWSGATTARVVSLNGTGSKAKVHSYKFFVGSKVTTFDKRTNRGQGYGPTLTVIGRASRVQGWQAGTACAIGTVTVPVAMTRVSYERAAVTTIVCTTTVNSYRANTANILIRSNRKIYYGQTSLKARYITSTKSFGTLVMDDGYGALISVTRPKGSRGWVDFRAWQAGQPCSLAKAPAGTP